MPSRENKNKQQKPAEENEDSFVGNDEQGLESGQHPTSDIGKKEEITDRDTYRSRNLEIEKERD